jgi:hypothetical protein
MMRIASSFVVVALVVAGCGSSSDDSDPGPLTSPIGCLGEGVAREPMAGPVILEGLRAAAGVDFLERRVIGSSASWPPLHAGTACAKATNAATCTAALEALTSDHALFPFMLDTFAQRPAGFYLVYSKGDAVGIVVTPEQLKALVGPVVAPVDAYAVAEAAGYRVECTKNWVREEADGFVVLTTKGQPCRRSTVVLFVGRDGGISTRSSTPGDTACL